MAGGFSQLMVGHLPSRMFEPCKRLIEKVYEQAGRRAPNSSWDGHSWDGQANVSYKRGLEWNVWINIAEGDGDGMGATHAFTIDAANKRYKLRGGSYVRLATRGFDTFLDDLVAYIHSPHREEDEKRRYQLEAENDAAMDAMQAAIEDEYEGDDDGDGNYEDEQSDDEQEQQEEEEEEEEEDEEDHDEDEGNREDAAEPATEDGAGQGPSKKHAQASNAAGDPGEASAAAPAAAEAAPANVQSGQEPAPKRRKA